jgi:hypothetical protein
LIPLLACRRLAENLSQIFVFSFPSLIVRSLA